MTARGHPCDIPAPIVVAAPIGADLVAALIRRGDSGETQRAYATDLRTFAAWLGGEGQTWELVEPDDLDRYREWLAQRYARATVNRRLSVVRILYAEARRRGRLAYDPADRLRGLRGRDERAGGVLTHREAREVLEGIAAAFNHPRLSLIARRDFAIISVLLRTGIRRSELANLRVGSLGVTGGHHVLSLLTKGAVFRTIKLPVDVWRSVTDWLELAASAGFTPTEAESIFVRVPKGGRLVSRSGLSDRSVHAIVARRLVAAGLPPLGPHALRATFVTLALEGGAPLHLTQRAAGHADPRTTERYWRRKDGLDDNAVDYIKL